MTPPRIAIACGGTGGHLFPGMAIGARLARYGCEATLMISEKSVDRRAAAAVRDMGVATLPALPLTAGNRLGFVRAFCRSYRMASRWCREHRPRVMIGMGGFTSAPAVLAARAFGAGALLHEANAIPGRANRWLAPWVDECCAGFSEALPRLRCRRVWMTGTPVRAQFQRTDPAGCRLALGLSPDQSVLLVVGGSQGAAAINDLILRSLPAFKARLPGLQMLHLSGETDCGRLREAYQAWGIKAVVRPFLTEMELALGAAAACVSRAGAASLAEFAAMSLPAVLIPYPSAADDHQRVNAEIYAAAGAARKLDQDAATPETLISHVWDLIADGAVRSRMMRALEERHAPDAADRIAVRVLSILEARGVPLPAPGIDPDESADEAPAPALRPRPASTPAPPVGCVLGAVESPAGGASRPGLPAGAGIGVP